MQCCDTCNLASEIIFNLTLIRGSSHTVKEYQIKLDAVIDNVKHHTTLCGQCGFINDMKGTKK